MRIFRTLLNYKHQPRNEVQLFDPIIPYKKSPFLHYATNHISDSPSRGMYLESRKGIPGIVAKCGFSALLLKLLTEEYSILWFLLKIPHKKSLFLHYATNHMSDSPSRGMYLEGRKGIPRIVSKSGFSALLLKSTTAGRYSYYTQGRSPLLPTSIITSLG